jgi:hypothetical protein
MLAGLLDQPGKVCLIAIFVPHARDCPCARTPVRQVDESVGIPVGWPTAVMTGVTDMSLNPIASSFCRCE